MNKLNDNGNFFFYLQSGLGQNSITQNVIKNVKKRIPLNRWARKTDYKKAIQFLATDDSCYMTGQSLIIDGGRTIW